MAAALSISGCNELLAIEEARNESQAVAAQKEPDAGAPDASGGGQAGVSFVEDAGVAGKAGFAGASGHAGFSGAVGSAGSGTGEIRGITTRASVSTSGAGADAHSESGSISSDGRYVAFASAADNLASEAWPYGSGVFIRDRFDRATLSGSSAIQSVVEGGAIHNPVLSGNAGVLVFATTATLKADQSSTDMRLFKARLWTEPSVVELVAETAHRNTSEPALNFDGTVLAYTIARGDDANSDIYVKDGTLPPELISATPTGSLGAGPSFNAKLNATGNLVAFESQANDLVVADGNPASDIFLRERGLTPRTERITVGIDGQEPNGPSWLPAISGNGQRIAFSSLASNLVPNDTNDKEDVFVYDRGTKKIQLVSVASDGHTQAQGASFHPAISANGRLIAFHSNAPNLTPEAGPFVGDPNDSNIFIHDMETGKTVRVSVPAKGAATNGASMMPALSADGRFVTFSSLASNLVEEDSNQAQDIFVYEFLAAPWL